MASVVKKNKKINVQDKKIFVPTHLKFNFSFISYDKNITKTIKSDLYDRIQELSAEPYLVVANYDKKIGFEFENLKITKKLPQKIYDNETRKIDEKYAIFRLYPNNNPSVVRIIGKFVDKIFYIIFIDVNGKLYKH